VQGETKEQKQAKEHNLQKYSQGYKEVETHISQS